MAPDIKPGRKKPASEPLSFTNTAASNTPPKPPSEYTRLPLFKIRYIENKPATPKDVHRAVLSPINELVTRNTKGGKNESNNLDPLPENTDMNSS
jgi:hypothetical protein